MSHRRLGMFLLVGSVLLVTPFMVSFSQGVEKSIFSAMATLADVKETLESKRDLLQEVYAESRLLDGTARDEQVALARKHYDYAADVFRLSEGFLKASAKRHPKYGTFWTRYEKTLGGLWQEIRDVQGKIVDAPETPPAQVAEAVAPSAPAQKDAAQTAASLGRAVPAVVARVQTGGDAKQHVLERYREGYQAFARGGEADLETSRKIFEEILDVQPGFHLARYWLARTYLLQNRVDSAGREAERLVKEQPNLQIARDLVRDVADIRKLRQVARPAQVAAAPVPAKPAAIPARIAVPAKPAAPPVAAPAEEPAPQPVRVAAAKIPARVPPAAPPARRSEPSRPSPSARVAPGELRIAKVPPISVPPASAAGRPRPIAVMVENSRHARPQSGLLKADVVYEAPVEGGITRFLAVFQDPEREVEELGPVRSARHYFVHQVPAMDAIYAHCGGSTLGYAAIKKEGVDHIDEIRTGGGFWRNKQRRAPHNLYTKLANITRSAKGQGFRLRSKKAGDVVAIRKGAVWSEGNRYLDIDLPYYSKYKVSYTYDPVTNLYARFINEEPHQDKLEGRQIAVENVVAMKIPMRKIDDYGRLDLELYGRGKAYVFRGGETIEGTWSRAGKGDVAQLRDARGEPIQMNPGRTWIHFIQPNRKIQVKSRPVPPTVVARLEARRSRLQRSSREVEAPAETVALAKAPALPPRGTAGIPAVIAEPRRGKAPQVPVSRSARGIPGTVVAEVPAQLAPARPQPVIPPAARLADKGPRKPAPSKAADVRIEVPPTLAVAVPDSGPTGELTAAQVPAAIRPLDGPPNRAESETWKNGSETEYDLADFSLDSF